MKKIIITYTLLICLACLLIPFKIVGEPIEKKLTSDFNQNWLKSIISIEVLKDEIIDENGTKKKVQKHIPIGTGFLIKSSNNHLILTTAKHVIIDKRTGKIKNNLEYRLNDKNRNSILVTEQYLKELSLESWFLSKDYDLSCRFIAVSGTSDIASIPQDSFLEVENVQAGAQIFLLGFPLGLRSEKYAKPIIRQGIVARSDPNNLIIDVGFYPGNSGGAAIYVPVIKLGQGFNSPILNEEKLVGVATEYISYIDTAVSKQTGRARITFEDNAGLCNVVPSDAIISLLNRDDVCAVDKKMTRLKK